MSRISTPYGPAATADDVAAGHDLTGTRALVTGGASGAGLETARSLSAAGAEVTIGVRDLDAGRVASADIAATTGRAAVVEHLDLADPVGAQEFAARWRGPLHLLINDAGLPAVPELQRTAEGWELQFTANHLGHFALARGLHDALAAARGARIVAVSSSAHHFSPVVFDDIHFERRPYDPWLACGQSKTACALFAVEATRRWSGAGIQANAVMPGAIAAPQQRHAGQEVQDERALARTRKTPQQAAATTMVAALSPEFAGIGGRYLEDCAEAEPVADDADPDPAAGGVRRWALDPAAAGRLWELSEQLLAQPRTAAG
ncbi:SDR family NAD(P)-dependent oxidoreductase [Saccharopolyspora sp. HNM0983]|uniref:Probable oxidoreductase n=1 Tax=Saccharopolyspora montiporae TaxID=2781240 RepID=A0A929FZV5_9PSEU|nr:SDR family NAD(P)-dependent oxidoreductase [Saccharopolyspora sp. HNM0983]MBE9372953.1 SDR family NAD(P)-dependent oxidoreductase [Saccharopolyspora sp. HNM0983]